MSLKEILPSLQKRESHLYRDTGEEPVVRPRRKRLPCPEALKALIFSIRFSAITRLACVESGKISVLILSLECRTPWGRFSSMSPPSLGNVKCFICRCLL